MAVFFVFLDISLCFLIYGEDIKDIWLRYILYMAKIFSYALCLMQGLNI